MCLIVVAATASWLFVESDAQCGAGFIVSGGFPFAAADISPDGEWQEGADMKLLHHSYSTNGVRPSGLPTPMRNDRYVLQKI